MISLSYQSAFRVYERRFIMAINKKNQKMFYFSSEYVKKFVETRIEDLAIETQRSSSYIIEKLILDGLLPHHEEAR